ncbi:MULTISPECIES: hypothetical protein [unclassified Streptomyces]|uniref:hypothetical protein n=1 Tax=unclassified Streptomyces TaxID=2593676 RepID=UPI0035DF9B18
MRKFQRAAVVAMAVAGLSAFGAGTSFANEGDAPAPVTAVANSSANALAVSGGYYFTPPAQPKAEPEQERHAEPEHYGHEGEGQ